MKHLSINATFHPSRASSGIQNPRKPVMGEMLHWLTGVSWCARSSKEGPSCYDIVCMHNLHKCGWTAAGSVFTYQFHFMCTECWRHNVPPPPPHIITGGKHHLMDLSIDIGSEKAALTLHVVSKQYYKFPLKIWSDLGMYKKRRNIVHSGPPCKGFRTSDPQRMWWFKVLRCHHLFLCFIVHP